MPQTIVIEKVVYKYDELDDKAQERAYEKWAENALDYEWWDCSYDDFDSVATALGFSIDRKDSSWISNGITHHSQMPKIYFSGFWSQGDGLCFSGSMELKDMAGAMKRIKAYAPIDSELFRIAKDVEALYTEFMKDVKRCAKRGEIGNLKQYILDYGIQVQIEGHDRGYYETVEMYNEPYGGELDEYLGLSNAFARREGDLKEISFGILEDGVKEIANDFATWMYRSLEKEYEYGTSKESFKESCEANDYTFSESGHFEY